MNHEPGDASRSGAYRFRIEGREDLLGRYEVVGAGQSSIPPEDPRGRLEAVLEALAEEGWRLVGVSRDEFVFRRRG